MEHKIAAYHPVVCYYSCVVFSTRKPWALQVMRADSGTPARSLRRYFKCVRKDITVVSVVYHCKKCEHTAISSKK